MLKVPSLAEVSTGPHHPGQRCSLGVRGIHGARPLQVLGPQGCQEAGQAVALAGVPGQPDWGLLARTRTSPWAPGS